MTENSGVLQKVRDMLPNPKRLAVMMAFMGCVNTLMAKTVVGRVADIEGNKTYLLTNEGMFKVESAPLVRALTSAGNKSGGDLVVKMDYDENTSKGIKGIVLHSPVRGTSGIRDMGSDTHNIYDDVNELITEGKNANIGRVVRKISHMVGDYSQDAFRDNNATVRVKAEHPEKPGVQVWAPYHKVDGRGQIKPEYRNGSQTNTKGYSQSQTSQTGRVYAARHYY